MVSSLPETSHPRYLTTDALTHNVLKNAEDTSVLQGHWSHWWPVNALNIPNGAGPPTTRAGWVSLHFCSWLAPEVRPWVQVVSPTVSGWSLHLCGWGQVP
jgi:hypothetical protein